MQRATAPECAVPDDVAVLATSPDYDADGMAFAATRAGALWCTTDRGRRWEPVTGSPGCPLTDRRVVGVAVSPRFAEDALVLAGSADGAVARSFDSGWTWEVVADLAGPVLGFQFSATFDRDHRVIAATRRAVVEIDTDHEMEPVTGDGPGGEHVAA